ncbi:MAG: hypothetical protein F2664_01550 [Actinobacteria bacterium]|uniref:Unannotated protein n=1 Tax=freshwater metagenome TaxID=449393 RepID=A0A6J6NRJ8_9ZZZZ|nr:hypothetical protein [Actinomycetota bacterium]
MPARVPRNFMKPQQHAFARLISIVLVLVLIPFLPSNLVNKAYAVGSDCTPATTSYSSYTVLSLTTAVTCNWTVPNGVTSIDLLLVGGGGGGGGGAFGGGGGAGGMAEKFGMSVTPGSTYELMVGGGGAGGGAVTSGESRGVTGEKTSFGSLAVLAGGGGGGYERIDASPRIFSNGRDGGSGGGSSENGAAGSSIQGNVDVSTPGYGFGGGAQLQANTFSGGGGGGAGGAGDMANSGSPGGGGAGRTSALRTGSPVMYSTGGDGGTVTSPNVRANAAANTGDGGDGANYDSSLSAPAGAGANGGTGILVIRYATATTVPGAPAIGTVTVTNSTTASVPFTAPTFNGGASITSYTATSNPGGITGSVSQSGSGTISVSGLTRGATYTFTVTASNSLGTSLASGASNSATVDYQVGNTGPGGGVVFYRSAAVFACGPTLSSNCNFLEFAPKTWEGGSTDPEIPWSLGSVTFQSVPAYLGNSATAADIGTGFQNTLSIINQNGTYNASTNRFAAGAVRAYAGGGLTDWYLPSRYELVQMCRYGRGLDTSSTTATDCTGGAWDSTKGTPDSNTWSSTQSDSANTWSMLSNSGWNVFYDDPKNRGYFARPIRAFGAPAAVAGAPTIGVATATGSTSATVAFTAPTSNGGATIASYVATSSPGGLTGTLNQAGSGTITVTGLLPGTAYTFTVAAINSVGTSISSTASTTITTNNSAPSAPSVSAASAGGSTFANVTIVAPSSTGGSAIDHYTVTSSPGGFTGNGWAAGTVRVYGLSPATSYTFTVTATNGIGTSPASSASGSMTTNAAGVYSVGDKGPGGGIIFYISSAGFTCDTTRNYCNVLEMALSDIGGGDVAWCSDTTHSVGATGEGIGFGGANTRAMVQNGGGHTACSAGAGYLADSYVSANGTSDWYLPSMNELQMMYYKFMSNGGELSTMGQFSDAPRYGNAYWSSTEVAGSSTNVLVKNFGNWFDGNPEYNIPKSTVGSGVGRVRPIRAFTNAPAASVPNAPTSVVAKSTGYSTASVAFTPSTFDGYSLITEYIAVSTPGNITGSIAAGTSGPIYVSGLLPGTSYTFKVKAHNSVGMTESAASASISTNTYGVYHVGDIGPSGGYIFFTTDTPFACASGSCNYVEAAPVDVTAGNWESATANALAYRGGGKSDWYLPSAEMLEYMWDALAYAGLGGFPCANTYGDGCRGVEYWSNTIVDTSTAYFKRFGVSGGWWYAGTAPKSEIREVRPIRAVATPTIAGAPTIGAVTQSGILSAEVSYRAPASDGGRTITEYRVTSSPGDLSASVSRSGSGSIVIHGLVPATTYRFSVVAINEAGNSTPSSLTSAYTTPAIPVISSANSGNGQVDFNITGWSSLYTAQINLSGTAPGTIAVDTSTATVYAVTIKNLLAGESTSVSVSIAGASTGEIVRTGTVSGTATAGSVALSNVLSVPSADLQFGRIALSSTGAYMLVADSNTSGLVYLSSNGGKSWSPQYLLGRAAWSRVAMSSTGQYMSAVAFSSKIWMSTNYGATWSDKDAVRDWKSVSISGDGHFLIATTSGTNNLLSSSNYGATWETLTSTTNTWRYTASTTNGSIIALCADGDGLYLSTDAGTSASKVKGFSAYSVSENVCSGIAISSNGTKIVAIIGPVGHMLISTNSGSTWSEVSRLAGISWSDLTMSADGTRITAIEYSTGYMYTSVDSGATWQKITGKSMNSSAYTSAGALVAIPRSTNILAGKDLSGICSGDVASLTTTNRVNDDDSATLFACFTNGGHTSARYMPASAGFITPDVGPWIVNGISFIPGPTSSNDPTKFSLYGCTSTLSTSCKVIVANGLTGLRTSSGTFHLRNTETYSFYRVVFENIRGSSVPGYGEKLEIAEVQLYGAPAPVSTTSNLGGGSTAIGGSSPPGITPRASAPKSTSGGFVFSILNFDTTYTWNVIPTNHESVEFNTYTGAVTVIGVASQAIGTVMITATKVGYISAAPLFVSGTAVAPVEVTTVAGTPTNLTLGLSAAGSTSSFDVGVGLPYSIPAGARILAEAAMTDRVDAGLGIVRLSLRDSSNIPIETVADAIAITLPSAPGTVPVYSPDGTSWVALPQLIPAYVGAVPTLLSTQLMAYYIDANGDTVILTRKL